MGPSGHRGKERHLLALSLRRALARTAQVRALLTSLLSGFVSK
jgi:hypothetical protein